MIRLEQPKITPGSTSMAVEIEVMALENPKQHYACLQVCYLIDDRLVLEMESSTYPDMPQYPLDWLGKAIKTCRKKLGAEFGNLVAGHLVFIEQNRIPQDEFAEIQAEFGMEAYPYPFMYDMDILVNPDPDGLAYAGIGMRFTGLSYVEITRFLGQIRDEVAAVFDVQQK